MIATCSTLKIGPYLFYIEKFIIQFKITEKRIGHHTRLRRNDDLRLWRGPAIKKKPPFSNAPALITCEIMRSKDAQCNTGFYEYRRQNNANFIKPLRISRSVSTIVCSIKPGIKESFGANSKFCIVL